MKIRDRGALFLLALFLAVACGGAWLPGRTLFARDLTYLFHPMHVWTAENLVAGRMPLWNPFVSGGVPWLGQPQTGVFYPGNLLFWFFPFAAGLTFFSMLHFFLSALGGYLWARAAGGSSRAALAAGLLWSLNGFWRARVEFPPLLAVLSWTPWFALLLRRARAVPLALAGALALTAGYWPQILWSGLLAFIAVGGFRRWRAVLGAAVAAAALAGVSLLPGLELMARSDRAAGLGAGVAGLYAFSPKEWLGLLWPWASAMPAYAYTGEKFFWLGCFFTGLTGATLAALAFAKTPGRRKWMWAAAFAAGAVLTLGAATPLFGFLRLARVRYPGQQAFWMTGIVLVAVTAGARRWERALHALGKRIPSAAVALLAAELLAYGAGMVPTIASDYFHRKPAWIGTVQGTEGRLFMTPRAISNMSTEGRDWEDTWTRLRGKGLSLSTLPYHLRNLNPYGFSLNPASTEALLSDLYSRSSYEAARPLLDKLSVRWVASLTPLTQKNLRLAGEDPWFLYERLDAPSSPVVEMDDPGWMSSGDGRRFFRPGVFRLGLFTTFFAWLVLAVWGFRRVRCL